MMESNTVTLHDGLKNDGGRVHCTSVGQDLLRRWMDGWKLSHLVSRLLATGSGELSWVIKLCLSSTSCLARHGERERERDCTAHCSTDWALHSLYLVATLELRLWLSLTWVFSYSYMVVQWT